VPLVVFALCESLFLSRLCRAVALALGDRDVPSSSDLALCLSFGFRSLVEVSFSRFISFNFLFGYKSCVLSMHSSRARLRTMCGSRTGGWSLASVMSD
jgi:hypothetical protein